MGKKRVVRFLGFRSQLTISAKEKANSEGNPNAFRFLSQRKFGV